MDASATSAVRVGITGYAHEVNGFADTSRATTASTSLARPVDSQRRGRQDLRSHGSGSLFGPALEIVELPVWEFGASGPLLGDDFRTIARRSGRGDRSRQPPVRRSTGSSCSGTVPDRTTDDLDADGTVPRAVRSAGGRRVPIVVVLDFHANVSTGHV